MKRQCTFYAFCTADAIGKKYYLFQVLREMGDRIGEGTYSFYNLVPNLVTTPSQAFGEVFGTVSS